MLRPVLFYFLFTPLFAANTALAEAIVVKYFQTDPRYEYRVELLKLALSKASDTPSAFLVQTYELPVTQSRGLLLLSKNEVDVAFLATNTKRETDFLPIRIPILRGILGFRVFLIHKDSREDFAGIKTLDQLRRHYVAGFGSQWADYNILTSNEIRVMGVAAYESLFKMLVKKRFDFFPRGINEAWNEVESKGEMYPDIAVEENIALYYPFPIYFFVNKRNSELANTIERGLRIALRDGSFRKLFLRYHNDIISQANMKGRTVFSLLNPTLPEGFPGLDTSWWLQNQ